MIEGKNVEFKREYMDDIKYAVIAFANTMVGSFISASMMTEQYTVLIM